MNFSDIQIKNGWRFSKLADLGFLGRGKSRHRPRDDKSLYGGEYPFIQTGDIKNANCYINSYSQTYNDKGLAQSKLWDAGTLCMTIAANIGDTAILNFPACFPDSVVGFISDSKNSNTKFIKYALDNLKRDFQSVSKGTTQDNLSLEKIGLMDILIPDLDVQNKIAGVLSVYDDLIENNENRIKILELMVQKLYIEWFVKLKFPGHEKIKMVDSGHPDFGMIPDGWEVKKIGSLLEIVKRKLKIQTSDYLLDGNYPIVDQGKDFIAGYTDEEMALYKESLIVFGDHTRCFKYCNFTFACGADGTQLLKSNNFETISQIYLYYIVKNSDLKNNHYARHFKFLKELDVLVADKELNSSFSDIANSFYEIVYNLQKQNINLKKSRDLLIPQLVGGKLLIKE